LLIRSRYDVGMHIPRLQAVARVVVTALLGVLVMGCSARPTIEGAEYGIIDVHVHFQYRSAGDLDRVSAWMDELGIGRCINLPLSQSRPRNDEEYRVMLENYAQYRGRIDRYCVIFPDEVQSEDEAVAILEREVAAGAVGFGEHYGVGLYFDDPANMRLYAACERVGLPVLFHMDRNKNMDDDQLTHLENALRAYPDCIFIAHSDWWRRVNTGACGRLLETYPNLFADISCTVQRSRLGADPALARQFFIDHADKLLFGSDSGWWTWSDRYDTPPEFAFVQELDLPADVKAKLLHGNAMRLFPVVHAGR